MAFDFRTVFQRALPYGGFLEHHGTDEHRRRWETVHEATTLTPAQKELLATFRRKMNILCLAGPWCGDCVNACPIFQRFAEVCPLVDLRFVNREREFNPAEPLAVIVKPGTVNDPDDIRSTPIGRILVKWGVLTPERVEKALLVQEERKANGLNVRIGDVMTDLGLISTAQRDQALAAQSGFGSLDSWDTAVARELMICGGSRVPVLVFLSEDGFECQRFGERTLATYREKALKRLVNLEGASCPTGLIAPPAETAHNIITEWLNLFERVQWMLLTSARLMRLHGES